MFLCDPCILTIRVIFFFFITIYAIIDIHIIIILQSISSLKHHRINDVVQAEVKKFLWLSNKQFDFIIKYS